MAIRITSPTYVVTANINADAFAKQMTHGDVVAFYLPIYGANPVMHIP